MRTWIFNIFAAFSLFFIFWGVIFNALGDMFYGPIFTGIGIVLGLPIILKKK